MGTSSAPSTFPTGKGFFLWGGWIRRAPGWCVCVHRPDVWVVARCACGAGFAPEPRFPFLSFPCPPIHYACVMLAFTQRSLAPFSPLSTQSSIHPLIHALNADPLDQRRPRAQRRAPLLAQPPQDLQGVYGHVCLRKGEGERERERMCMYVCVCV